MKKIYILLSFVVTTLTFGQTFYSENVGTATGTLLFPANAWQVGTPVTYSGSGDTRATSVSSGYSGASGGRNVFLTGTAGKDFRIDGLNTSAYTMANLQLSFGYITSINTVQVVVEKSTDGGTTWAPITFTGNTTTAWTLVTVSLGQIPSSATLSLRFTQPATAQMRIDDIKLTNASASCLLSLGTPTASCDASTLGIDTYTATIPYTGGGMATYVVTPTTGTVAGDNPSSVATGNILISGISEATALSLTITGGTCNLSTNINAPECKPINALPSSESFPYSVGGSLGAEQKWTNVNTGDNVLSVSGSLTYSGITSTGNSVSFSGAGSEVFTPFTSTTSGTNYNSFLMNVTSMGLVTADGNEAVFASVTDNAKGFKARIITKRVSATSYLLGCTAATTAPAATTAFGSTAYNVGDTVLVIVGYDFTANSLKMWLNPVVSTFTDATPATITETPATAFANLGGFILRQDSDTTTPTITIDELRTALTTPTLLSTNKINNNISGLSIYPNPAKNILNVTSDSLEAKSVAIYNVLGKVVLTANVTNNPINIANLATGVYVVKVTEADKTATRKLVIE